jgi:ribonucleoside-diphosphate reductase alpha chain
MFVKKRNGKTEIVSFDKITKRITHMCNYQPKLNVDPLIVAHETIKGLYNGVSTQELDILTSEISASKATKHPDYSILASRISISNLHKQTEEKFSEVIKKLFHFKNLKNQKESNLIKKEIYDVILVHHEIIDSWACYDRDYMFDYFGFKTLEKSYLLKINNIVVERPQHLFLRVSLGIHFEKYNDNWLAEAKKTYDLMSQGFFTHATPTLFNAGTPNSQLSSCFLIDINSDSLDGIYKTLHDCAIISKHAGGIGLSIHQIRSKNSFISGTNGNSNGIVPMLRVFNATARYVDQGGGKRKGSIAIYLEPWHPDIEEVLDLKKNTGSEEQRARDLFYAMWIPDLFMSRVVLDEEWSLFCPDVCPRLNETFGKEFEDLYCSYEKKGLQVRKISARTLMTKIVNSQIETGNPYILFKDTINETCNQKNLGTIKSSNLCTEICQFTDKNEIAVCNLASICLPKCVDIEKKVFNFDMLFNIVQQIVKNLNKVINKTYYPVSEAKYSNFKHRPIGIGVQGLADVFAILRFSFDSDEASNLNKEIFETIYFAALSMSHKLAIDFGYYETFEGSPLSKGLFHFELMKQSVSLSKRWDWDDLRKKIKKDGVYNSLMIALMPTASTSLIMGNNEAFEPFVSNIYTRRLLSGEFIIVNKHLVRDLIKINLWNDEIRDSLIKNNGSVQNLNIPTELKNLYKTAFEIPPKVIIDLARDRQFFVDQSQSMNIFIQDPCVQKITKMHVYSWKQGLKTGLYYLRTKPAVNAVKFTIAPENKKKECQEECLVCSA